MFHGIPDERVDYNLEIYLPTKGPPAVDMHRTVCKLERDGDGRLSTGPCFGEILLEKSKIPIGEGSRNDDDD